METVKERVVYQVWFLDPETVKLQVEDVYDSLEAAREAKWRCQGEGYHVVSIFKAMEVL